MVRRQQQQEEVEVMQRDGVRPVRVIDGGDMGTGSMGQSRGIECLPISSVAPFQGPRFPVLL